MRWLEDDKIKLRAPEPLDLDMMFEMENDTSIWDIGCNKLPFSRFALKEYIANSTNDIFSQKQARFIIETIQGQALGIIDLNDFDPYNSRAEVCIAILEQYRGRGYGACALSLLRDYAFRMLQIHQLFAFVSADNTISKRLFSFCGFTEELLLKSWIRREAVFNDVYLLQCIRDAEKNE